MRKRLIRWITYNFAFALLPLVVASIMHSLNGTLTTQFFANSPEILFFALMVSATALGDLSEVRVSIGKDLLLQVSSSCLLLGTVVSAILYGALLHDSIVGPNSVSFQGNLLNLAIIVAVMSFVASTTVEVLLGRIIDAEEAVRVES